MRLSTHRFSCIRETSATTSGRSGGCSWRTQTALPLTTDRPDRTVHAATRAAAGKFLLARLGSFFAIAPLGAWTAVHLWSSLAAFDSPRAWQDAVSRGCKGSRWPCSSGCSPLVGAPSTRSGGPGHSTSERRGRTMRTTLTILLSIAVMSCARCNSAQRLPVDASARLTPVELPAGGPGIGFDDLRFSAALKRLLVPAGRSGNLDLIDPATLS